MSFPITFPFTFGSGQQTSPTVPPSPVDPNHFTVNSDGSLTPQPWMQWRCVATAQANPTAGSYAVSTAYDHDLLDALQTSESSVGNEFTQVTDIGDEYLGVIGAALGTNLLGGVSQPAPATIAAGVKNDLLYNLTQQWTNDSPIDQWVYGMITRGGVRLTIQARTQAYILVLSGFTVGGAGADLTPTLTLSSAVGCGANLGLGGVLSIGTAYAIIEERQNGVSFPVAPELCGWTLLPPGDTYFAALQVRFASPYWETTSIDGGDTETETSYDDGGTRLDIYAIPVLPVAGSLAAPPGPQLASWLQEAYGSGSVYYCPPWQTTGDTLDLVVLGSGGGGGGEVGFTQGEGGTAGAWASATITYGTDYNSSTAFTVITNPGGTGVAGYFTPGGNGAPTSISWTDPTGHARNVTGAGGIGGWQSDWVAREGLGASFGQGPGDFTLNGQPYPGGSSCSPGVPGKIPGGGGGGSIVFEPYAGPGGPGQAWILARHGAPSTI
jgi:hypothetical protein